MIVRGVVAVVAALALAPAAHAASATSVVMLSDSGDYIGGGVPRLYHPRNAQISASGSTAYLDVSVSGGNLGNYFDLEFGAPPGWVLTPGTYVGAQRAPFRQAGRPGIDISGDGRGCNTIEDLMRSASQPLYELLSMGREGDLVAAPKVSPRRRQPAAGTVAVAW